MSSTNHVSHSPDVPALLGVLEENGVRYVLVGSVAALAYGMEDFVPGDLDIVPGGDRVNLSRLSAVLDGVEASPEPVAGHWEARPDGEYAWVSDDMTPELAAKFERWEPDPDDVDSFDFLFRTRLGNFDVVPKIAGTFRHLIRRAPTMTLHGREVRVAHIDDLLAKLTKPRREKDASRVRQLRDIQSDTGPEPRPRIF